MAHLKEQMWLIFISQVCKLFIRKSGLCHSDLPVPCYLVVVVVVAAAAALVDDL